MIRCMYTCKMCDAQKVIVMFRRRYLGEDIVHYVNDLATVMYRNHRIHFKSCTSLIDVMIPIGSEMGIGFEPEVKPDAV